MMNCDPNIVRLLNELAYEQVRHNHVVIGFLLFGTFCLVFCLIMALANEVWPFIKRN